MPDKYELNQWSLYPITRSDQDLAVASFAWLFSGGAYKGLVAPLGAEAGPWYLAMRFRVDVRLLREINSGVPFEPGNRWQIPFAIDPDDVTSGYEWPYATNPLPLRDFADRTSPLELPDYFAPGQSRQFPAWEEVIRPLRSATENQKREFVLQLWMHWKNRAFRAWQIQHMWKKGFREVTFDTGSGTWHNAASNQLAAGGANPLLAKDDDELSPPLYLPYPAHIPMPPVSIAPGVGAPSTVQGWPGSLVKIWKLAQELRGLAAKHKSERAFRDAKATNALQYLRTAQAAAGVVECLLDRWDPKLGAAPNPVHDRALPLQAKTRGLLQEINDLIPTADPLVHADPGSDDYLVSIRKQYVAKVNDPENKALMSLSAPPCRRARLTKSGSPDRPTSSLPAKPLTT